MSLPTSEVAPAGATCPTCGLDVAGYFIGTTGDGRRTWDRPFAWREGPTGTTYGDGGLTHVEGGARCAPTEPVATAATTEGRAA